MPPKGWRDPVKAERDALIVQLYADGLPAAEIAARFGMKGISDVSAIVKRAGAPLRRQAWGSACTVEECPDEMHMKGYCRHHYYRFRQHGDPLAGGPRRTKNPMDRFARYVDKNGPYCEALGSQCWMWTGNHLSQNGYALTYSEALKQTTTAHRWAYALLVEPVPKDMTLDHLCRNILCVNPSHMEIVSLVENIQRAPIAGVAKIAAAKTHCKEGHEFDIDGVWYPNGKTKTGIQKWARRCAACDPRYLTYPSTVRERTA